MTISFFHFPQQLFTYMWACLPPAPTQPQCVCGHMSPLWAPHSQELSAPDALKTLELGESWSPHVSCTVSEDSAIHPFRTEPALCGKEGRKIVFVYQMLQHHLHKMYLSFNSVRSCEGSHKNGILSCLDSTMYYLHLIFGFFHYEQDFLQWYSWAGKKKYGDKKKFVKRQNFSFHLHCLNCNICTYESWASAWPFNCFFIYCSLGSASRSVLLHVFR